MQINHLIVGVNDISSSTEFYEKLFGFKMDSNFIDTGTNKEGVVLSLSNNLNRQVKNGSNLQLLLVPFSNERLPNPQHMAFEVETSRFQLIYEKAQMMGLKIRSKPNLDSVESGTGTLEVGQIRYENFYILDPSGMNIEVMRKVKD